MGNKDLLFVQNNSNIATKARKKRRLIEDIQNTLMAISPQEIEKKRQRDGFGRVGRSIRKKEEARSHDGKNSSILTIRRCPDISVQNSFSLDLTTHVAVGWSRII